MAADPLLPWKTVVRARVAVEEDEVEILAASGANGHLTHAKRRIAAAKHRSAGGTFWRGVASWFTGADQELCWNDLHEADVHLVHVRSIPEVIDEIPDLKNRIRMEFPKRSDAYGHDLLQELDEAKRQLKSASTPVQGAGRQAVAHVMHVLYERSHKEYQAKRSFRNIVFALIVAVTVFAVALAVPGLGLSRWIGDTLKPIESAGTFTTVWRVEFVGALGGLLAGAAAVQRLRGLSGSYSLPFLLAVLKLPMGAITGLIGAILLQSSDFWIDPATDAVSFYALVLVFGASQQLITRLVDARAAEIADKANPAKENPDS